MTDEFDVVVVGGGVNGALLTQLLREHSADVSVLVLDAGRDISTNRGEHLVEADFAALEASYADLMRRARQIEYVKGAVTMNRIDGDAWDPEVPGIFPAAFFGHNFAQFPGASVAWNVGGMGVHWAAAVPWPYAEEVPGFLPRGEWDADLETARRLLHASSGPLVDNPFAPRIIEAIRAAVPSPDPRRRFDYMPLAGTARRGRPFARTGPREIAPVLFDASEPRIRLRTGVLAVRVEREGGRITGVVGRDVVTGDEEVYTGRQYVIAADALRTPQLLWASGIRPAALGVRLNEHASIDGDVRIDAERLGLAGEELPVAPDGEPFLSMFWSPSIGAERPAQGQLLQRVIDGEHVLGVAWYCATEIRPENRIEFSDTLTDALGLPHMTVHFSYSENDRAQIRRTMDVQRAAANAVGAFPDRDSEMLPAGASLHYTGTVRMGPADDGTTVCDTDGRVWDLDNLFLVGNGVVPTALTCNATLTGATLTVRTARALAHALTPAPSV